jgi:hypothetical protein
MAEEVVKAGRGTEREVWRGGEDERRASQGGLGGPSSRGVWFIFGGRGPLSFLVRHDFWVIWPFLFMCITERGRDVSVSRKRLASAVSSRFYAALKIWGTCESVTIGLYPIWLTIVILSLVCFILSLCFKNKSLSYRLSLGVVDNIKFRERTSS